MRAAHDGVAHRPRRRRRADARRWRARGIGARSPMLAAQGVPVPEQPRRHGARRVPRPACRHARGGACLLPRTRCCRGRATSSSRPIRSTRRTPSSCARSSCSPGTSRRRSAGRPPTRPARRRRKDRVMTDDVIDQLIGIERATRSSTLRDRVGRTRSGTHRRVSRALRPRRGAVAGSSASPSRTGPRAVASAPSRSTRTCWRPSARDARRARGGAAGAATPVPTAIPAGTAHRRGRRRPDWRPSAEPRTAVGDRLAAALDHAHLLVFHPRDASAERCRRCSTPACRPPHRDAVAARRLPRFQIRVVAGLTVLQGSAPMTDTLLSHTFERPNAFTQAELGWMPWLEPLAGRGAHRPALGRARRRGPGEIARISCCSRAIPTSSAPAPGPTRTSSTTRRAACRAPSASSRPRRRRASTAASSAPPCTPASPRTTRNARDDVQRLLDEGIAARRSTRWNAIIAAVGRADRDPGRVRRRSTSSGCATPASTTSPLPT